MKCFLSHSSSDKGLYVETVVQRLPKGAVIYDAYTFEAGMPTLGEILKSLDVTDIFVLFLSNGALKSDWVKREIVEAKERFDAGTIDKIYPIIIDPSLKHDDPRIPEWLRNEYNLRLVSRPVAAARRIEQRMRELSWARHPKIKQKQKIFVGRNNLIAEVEERLDDTAKEIPLCILASGLKRIGRRTLLRNALVKTNIVDQHYDPLRVYLSREDSIEGLIVKLYDLGLTPDCDITGLIFKTFRKRLNSPQKFAEGYKRRRTYCSSKMMGRLSFLMGLLHPGSLNCFPRLSPIKFFLR